jgi:tRNA dimethylallyltransferase
VLRHTGEPIGRWRARGSATLTPGTFAAARLEPDRAVLAERSLLRLRRMAEAGALEEVAALTALGPAPDRPAFKALGFREFAAHLEGRLSLEEALLAAAAATRRYAKRQATWFRHQAPEFTPVPLTGLDDGYEALLGALRLGA